MILALKKSFVDGLSPDAQGALGAIGNYVAVLPYSGVLYTDGVDVWRMWHDTRFTLQDAAYYAALAGHADEIPEMVITHDDILAWFDTNVGVIIPTGMEDDPWQAAIDLNGSPTTIRMGNSVPDGWTPVEV